MTNQQPGVVNKHFAVGKWGQGGIILALLSLLFWVLLQFAPGGDWQEVFRPSMLSFLSGHNPYNELRFFSPPWMFVILAPLSLLPPLIGSIGFALIGAVGYLAAFYRLKVRPVGLVFLVITPAFLAALFNPNFDWAVALGYTLPLPIGLFFILAKPQIGAPLAFFWLIEAWRLGGYRNVVRVFGPILLAYGASIILFGPWMFHMGGATVFLSNTANVWPYGLMAGAVLLVSSLKLRRANLALIAGPFFSPYLAPYSWLPALAVLPTSLEISMGSIAFWMAWLIQIKG